MGMTSPHGQNLVTVALNDLSSVQFPKYRARCVTHIIISLMMLQMRN